MLYAGILLIALLVPACGRAGPETATATEEFIGETSTPLPVSTPTPAQSSTQVNLQGTVSIWHSWNEPEVDFLIEVIGEFRGTHPEVQFDVLYVPFDDLLNRLLQSDRASNLPSILIGPGWWGPLLYDDGLIADVTEFADSSLLNTINPVAIDSVRYQDAVIGIPYSINGVVLYRNRQILPRQPQTFEQLVDMAKSATSGDKIGAMLERSFFYSGGHLVGLGGEFMDPEGLPAFNNESGLSWLDLLSSFELAGPTDFATNTDVELFKENRLGVIIDGTWNMSALAEAIGPQNLAIDPWPLHRDGNLSGFVQSRNLYLSSAAKKADLISSWEFIVFFLSTDNQLALAELGQIPALEDVFIRDSHLAQAMVALQAGSAYPVLPVMEIYTRPLEDALIAVFEHQTPPDIALQAAHDTILEAHAQRQAASTP